MSLLRIHWVRACARDEKGVHDWHAVLRGVVGLVRRARVEFPESVAASEAGSLGRWPLGMTPHFRRLVNAQDRASQLPIPST